MKILDNGIAIVETDSHIGRWIQESGRIDHDMTVERHILPLLKPDDFVVDAGADVGSHTVRYVQAVPDGWVTAFEPNPDEFRCLRYNTRNYSNVACYMIGLSDRSEMASLNVVENTGAGYLNRNDKGSIVCLPLDCMNMQKLDFFKLDIEGYELFALQGSVQNIKRFKPKILLEMNAGTLARNNIIYEDIFQWLSCMGYEWRSFPEPCSLSSPQYDLLATPKK